MTFHFDMETSGYFVKPFENNNVKSSLKVIYSIFRYVFCHTKDVYYEIAIFPPFLSTTRKPSYFLGEK